MAFPIQYAYSTSIPIMEANAIDQLNQDRFLIEKIFSKSSFDDLIVIEIIKDLYDLGFDIKKEITSKLDEYIPQDIFSIIKDGDSIKKSGLRTYKIPNTDCIIHHSYYGFVLDKKYIKEFENFISSIKLEKKIYLDDSKLNSVIWNDKTESLKKDIVFFSKSKKWFETRDLPYSRSYLLYGPPGNGKTSAIRAISKYYNRPVETFSFSGRYEDPDKEFSSWILGDESVPRSLNKVITESSSSYIQNIETAKKVRILLLEDIDRYFSEKESSKSQVSLSAILNCLDGVTQRSNSILIATANDPKKLDPEVFLRPGRFDMRIPFDCPDETVIFNFLKMLCKNDSVSDTCIKNVSKSVIGHSMAFVKGIFLNAANKAFSTSDYKQENCIINDSDILESVEEMLSNLGRQIKSNKNGVGYY